jgi:hypothetical protein
MDEFDPNSTNPELKKAIAELGSTTSQVAEQLHRWNTAIKRVLGASAMVSVLNETYRLATDKGFDVHQPVILGLACIGLGVLTFTERRAVHESASCATELFEHGEN